MTLRGKLSNDRWILVLPAGMPETVVKQLHRTVAKSLQEDEVKKRFADMRAQPVGNTSAEITDFLHKVSAKCSAVIRKGSIKVD